MEKQNKNNKDENNKINQKGEGTAVTHDVTAHVISCQGRLTAVDR